MSNTDKYGVDEVQFLRSHRPLARRLTELEAENARLHALMAAAEDLGPWMSAALSDPLACKEFKDVADAFLTQLQALRPTS